jgi:DNA-binding transcriptional LysR family regulator
VFRLSLDALLVLDAIARRGSFAAAAEEVHRTTSTLSYTVRKLERDLGVRLFDRSGHRAVLTEHGRLLLSEGRELLDQASALERRMRTLGRGWEPTLHLCVNELVGLAPLFAVVAEFQAAGHPTRLRIDTGVLGGPWEALIAQRADLAICEVPAAPPAGIAHAPLWTVAFVFAVAPGHPLVAASQPLKPADIRRHRVVVAADSATASPARSSGIANARDVLTVGSLAAKFEAQVAGLGVGFLPAPMAAPALDDGQLVALRVAAPKPRVALSLAWRADAPGPALRWFVERLRALAPD